MFTLHETLKQDCFVLGALPLSLLLMSRDANYPWFILVPQRAEITEIYQLTAEDQQQLLLESEVLSRALMAEFAGDKLNIAALGNMVPQLHIHHIVRFKGDAAWPKPVWGQVAGKVFSGGEGNLRMERIAARLGGMLLPVS